MEKSREEIEKEIIQYLDETSSQKGTLGIGCGLTHGNALVLATCKENQPRATALDFFNEGITVYIFGGPGGKIGNLRANPNVSAVIYQPMDHSKMQKSLQMWGKATMINLRKNKKLFEEKFEKWGIINVCKFLVEQNLKKDGIPLDKFDAELGKFLLSLNMIKIEPERIILTVFTSEFTDGYKYTWTKS
jgi:hypothetical protein